MFLDTATRTLEIDLNGAVATNELPVTVSWVDVSQTTFAMTGHGTTITLTTGTTAATITAAPGASTTRQIKEISVPNIDTAAVTLWIQINDNTTLRRQTTNITLAVGDSLQFTDANGWRVTDSNGSTKFSINNVTGNLTVGGTLAVTGATTLSGALTYGGVTLSNAVTGTGNMVLSASPTFTGTLTAAAGTFSSTLTAADNVGIAATKRIYLDGVAMTGDTYILESSANVVQHIVGGATTLQLGANIATITGTAGGNTLKIATTSAGDALLLSGLAAGSGAIFNAMNNALTDFEPLAIKGETVELHYRTGAGTTTTGLTVGVAGAVTIPGTLGVTNNIDLTEMTAPAGTANTARLFAVDNGAGKTVLKVIFGSGAAQQIAIEP